MKWPNKMNLCKDCSSAPLTPWFKNKLEEFVDMGYSYSGFRPYLLVCAKKDLCPDCAKKVIECADRVNDYEDPSKPSTEEMDKRWKDCHGWGY